MKRAWVWPRQVVCWLVTGLAPGLFLPHASAWHRALVAAGPELQATLGAALAGLVGQTANGLLRASELILLDGDGRYWLVRLRPWFADAWIQGWQLAPLYSFLHLTALGLWLGLLLPLAWLVGRRHGSSGLLPTPAQGGWSALYGTPWWQRAMPLLPLFTLLWSLQGGAWEWTPLVAAAWLYAARWLWQVPGRGMGGHGRG